LIWVAHSGNVAAVRILIELGANVNQANSHAQSTLLFAASKGNLAVV
jgi:ankyrin repeat protein